jgi:excinuclease UvrABC ATPase subunit
MESSDLSDLSRIAGVDFNALRSKYTRINESTPLPTNNNIPQYNSDAKPLPEMMTPRHPEEKDHEHSTLTVPFGDPWSFDESKSKDISLLDKYQVCKACGGSGIVKFLYNHMMMEKNCDDCDGDAIQLKNKFDDIVQSEKMER